MKKIAYHIILLLFVFTLWWGTYPAFSQSSNFKTYSVEDGLPQSQVTAIFQDKHGYLWFGTLGGGICRYDGNSFSNYFEKDGLSSNIINCIYEDSKNNLWIGTDRGLSKYTPSFEMDENAKMFQVYTNYDGLINNSINDILEDKKGNLWIGTNNGLSRVKLNDTTKSTITFHNYSSADGWNFNRIQSLCEDKMGNIWFGTYGIGVNAIIGTHVKNDEPLFTHYSKTDGLSSNMIWSVMEDKSGNIWFGTDGDGISILISPSKAKNSKNKKSKWKYITTENGLIDNVINTLIRDNQGDIWIGTNDGISYISEINRKSLIDRNDPQVDQFKNYTKTQGIPNKSIISCFEDKEGNVWFGTDGGGACKYVRRMFTSITEDDGISNNIVMSIIETMEGDKWIGTYGYGLNKQLCECKYVDGSRVTTFTKGAGISNNLVMSGIEDRDGNLWFGTYGGGINRIKLENLMDNKYEFDFFTNKNGLKNNMIMSIYQDKSNNIWFGTYGGGVSFLHKNYIYSNEPEFINFTSKDGLANNKVMAITEDNNGNIWLGTFGGGANMLTFANPTNVSNPTITVIKAAQGLTNNRVISILQDTLNNIWMGTYGGGICILRMVNNITTTNDLINYDPENQGELHWTYITRASGLSDDRLALMEFDDDGNLWAGTNNGMNKILIDYGFNTPDAPKGQDSTDETVQEEEEGMLPMEVFQRIGGDLKIEDIKNYGKEEGFIGSECNHNAVFKNFDGVIYFGTVSGLIQYHPTEDISNDIPPSTNLSNIKLDFEEVNWISFADSIDMQSGLPLSLKLSHANNHLTFEYIGISLTIPEKVRYQFKLEGFDTDWAPVTNETRATYSNIPPGEFTFKVMACNNDGVWNPEPITYSFIILPPFWQTWWFYILCMIVGASSIFAFIKIRERSLLIAKKELETQVTLRTKELSQEKEKVEAANKEISMQNEVVKLKNKEITDSIKYAKQIQAAIMVPREKIYQALPESFILYKPKDIVSGDFYFFTEAASNGTDTFIIGAVDCTGHGVPGAFMSMIGSNLLHQIVTEKGITKPSEILNQLDIGVRTALHQETEDASAMDGMDIALCKIQLLAKKVDFAGAHRPLVIVRNMSREPTTNIDSNEPMVKTVRAGNKIELIKANKRGIGGLVIEKRNYTNHEIQLKEKDCIYFFSDGYHDQFGGAKSKKYSSRRLREFLGTIHDLDMPKQKEALQEELKNWMGSEEQIDDILVIGVRF